MPKLYIIYKDGRDPLVRTTLESAVGSKHFFKPQQKLRILTWEEGRCQYGTLEAFEKQLQQEKDADNERRRQAEITKSQLRRQLADLEAKFPSQ